MNIFSKNALNLIELKSEWQVLDDLDWYIVGNKDLYFDEDTYELYECNEFGDLSLISQSAVIYNQFNEQIY